MVALPSFSQLVTFQFLYGLALITVFTTPRQGVFHSVLVVEELFMKSVLKFTHKGQCRQLSGSSHLRWWYLCDHGADHVLFLHPCGKKLSFILTLLIKSVLTIFISVMFNHCRKINVCFSASVVKQILFWRRIVSKDAILRWFSCLLRVN